MTFQWKVIFVICLFFSAKPLRYSRSICPVFVGATLRGRPSMGKISFQCRPRWHATNFVHFAALLLMTGFSYIPQNRANAPSADDAALGKMFFHSIYPRIGSRRSLASLTRNSACKFRMEPKVPIRSRRQAPLQRPWNPPFRRGSGHTSHNQMLCPLRSGQVHRNTIPLPTGHKR